MNTNRYIDIQSQFIGKQHSLTIGSLSSSQVIDFTSENLDPRIIYTGPSHAYLAKDGTIKFTTANQYPLEYRNGVPVGRHEPEPLRTNLVSSVNYENIGPSGATVFDWNYGTVAPTIQDSGLGFKEAISTATANLTAIYSETTNTFIAAAQNSGSPATWTRIYRTVTNPSQAALRWYVARLSGSDYLLARCVAVAPGDYIASVYRKVDANGLHSLLAQMEIGSIATSPIISGQGAQASRAESKLSVAIGNASSIIINYDNGTSQQVDKPAATYQFGNANQPWSSRYISNIIILS